MAISSWGRTMSQVSWINTAHTHTHTCQRTSYDMGYTHRLWYRQTLWLKRNKAGLVSHIAVSENMGCQVVLANKGVYVRILAGVCVRRLYWHRLSGDYHYHTMYWDTSRHTSTRQTHKAKDERAGNVLIYKLINVRIKSLLLGRYPREGMGFTGHRKWTS